MRKHILTFTLLFAGLTAFAQQFEPMMYDGLPYQQLASNIDGAEKPALVVFLHGGHARGEDNQKQIQLQAVKENPDLFAAAFIASGNHKGISPEQLTGTPLYIFDILSGMNHPDACHKAFTSKRLKWLFEQKKAVN